MLAAREVYRVESTGMITLSTWTLWAFAFIPSPKGGYVRGAFYASPPSSEGGMLMVSAYEDGDVKAADPTALPLAAALGATLEQGVRAAEYVFKKTGDKNLIIVGTGAIWALAGDTYSTGVEGILPDYLGFDIAQAGVRAGEEFHFYVGRWTKAVVFASRDLWATVDGSQLAFAKDSYTVLGPGYHKIGANEPMVVEVLGTQVPPEYNDWGTYLVCDQDLEVSYSLPSAPPDLLPTRGMSLLTFLALGTAIAVSAAVVTLVWWRRRKEALASGEELGSQSYR